jgi:hypothetical protein
MIHHVPLYFVQRRPEDLGKFSWIIDGKELAKVTSWEKWWAAYAIGALANKSTYHPGGRLEGANYSHYDRFRMVGHDGEEGTDLALLMADLRFSSSIEFGLEWIDILTNAIRRALIGNLGIKGWGGIVQTMIHRRKHYIEIVRLDGVSKPLENPPYADVVNYFRGGGKPMLTEHQLRLAAEEENFLRS